MREVFLLTYPLILTITTVEAYRGFEPETIEKLTRLETQVSILTNEVTRLKDTVAKLRCDKPTEGEPASSDEDENELIVQDEVILPLQLREVRREAVSDGMRYSVQYWAQQNDVFVYWYMYPHAQTRNTAGTTVDNVSETEPGLKENYIAINYTDLAFLYLLLETENVSYTLRLEEDITNHTNVYRDLSNVLMVTEPSLDIVYEPGQNATFTVTFTDGSEFEKADTYLVNLESLQLWERQEQKERIFSEPVRTELLDSTEYVVGINTATYPFSGYLEVSSKKQFESSNLISWLTMQKSLSLRPTTQAGPYPPGFLEFLSLGQEVGSEHIPEFCEDNVACLLYCAVVGDEITSVTFTRVFSNGRREPVPDTNIVVRKTWRHKWLVAMKPASASTSPQKYECRAESAPYGKMITKIILASVHQLATFNPERTNIREVNATAVEISCEATGVPTPDLSISLISYVIPYNDADESRTEGDTSFMSIIIPKPINGNGTYCIAEQSDGIHTQMSTSLIKVVSETY